MEAERRYILTRCTAHPEHFFIRAIDEEPCGACVQIFSEDLARKVDDLDQINFSQRVPLQGEVLFQKLLEGRKA